MKRTAVNRGMSPQDQLNLLQEGNMELWHQLAPHLPQDTKVRAIMDLNV